MHKNFWPCSCSLICNLVLIPKWFFLLCLSSKLCYGLSSHLLCSIQNNITLKFYFLVVLFLGWNLITWTITLIHLAFGFVVLLFIKQSQCKGHMQLCHQISHCCKVLFLLIYLCYGDLYFQRLWWKDLKTKTHFDIVEEIWHIMLEMLNKKYLQHIEWHFQLTILIFHCVQNHPKKKIKETIPNLMM
jgi:hypothetical protein